VVGGEKPVQEMVMIGWVVYNKKVEIRSFRKVFKIPDGVVLDQIQAKFNEEESILTIVMPKLEKGISGVGIEEVNEEEVEREKGKSKREQVVANEVLERGSVGQKIQEKSKEPNIQCIKKTDGVVVKETNRGGTEKTKIVEEIVKNDTVGENFHEETKDPKIPSMEEPHQIAEEAANKGGLEATKTVPEELPKKEYIEETVQEKIEERKIEKMETTDGALNEKVGQGKPHTVQTVADKEPKREKEIQQVTETSEKAAPEKVEKCTTGEFHQAETEVPQETKKQKPDQEPQQAETPQPERPVEQHDKDEDKEREETHGVGNEIQEASNKSCQGKKGESLEMETHQDHGEEATQKEQPAPKRSKLRTPGCVAGSALVVILIVLVFQRIRSRKR
jgi:hypothetical protein